MQINLDSFPENGSDSLRELTQRKVERLGKFYDRIVEADVYFRETGDQQQPCAAEVRLNVPGDRLFCRELGASYEEAIDKVSHAMERQVKRFKEKHAGKPV